MAFAMTPVPGQTSQPIASDSSVQNVTFSVSEVVFVVFPVVLPEGAVTVTEPSGEVVVLSGTARTGADNENNAKIETTKATRRRRNLKKVFCTVINSLPNRAYLYYST